VKLPPTTATPETVGSPDPASQPLSEQAAVEAAWPVPIVPDHEIVRLIGHGAYGRVWLGRSALGAWRAVKTVYRRDFEDLRPFEREFRGLQKFEPISRSHEGVVPILQVGRSDAYFYYVMELADPSRSAEVQRAAPGLAMAPEFDLRDPESYVPRTLREDLRCLGRLPAVQCVELGLALASALAHLHQHGLVHRDVKPSNIIMVRGRPKLADIGLVTDAGERSIVGTEGYLPPEGAGTARADIFSLGKVIYEMSTGQDRRRFPDLPPDVKDWPDGEAVLELNQVVVRACAYDPSRRYPRAEAIIDDLKLLRDGRSVRSQRAVAERIRIAKRALVAAAACGLLSGLLFLGRGPASGYPPSPIAQVNGLVERGYHFARRRTPENRRNALQCFHAALQQDPHYLPAYFGLYYTQVVANRGPTQSSGEREETPDQIAVDLFRLFPHSAEAQSTRGLTLWYQGHFAEARAIAYRATQTPAASRVGEACVHSYYGWMLMESGRQDDALAQFRLAEKLHPESATVYQLLGQPYAVKRQFENALHEYRESLKYEDRQAQAHYLIARVYEEQTNFFGALEEDAAGNEVEGALSPERKAFFDGLREAIRDDPIKGYWRKKLALASNHPHPDPYTLATLQARLGDWDRAYQLLETALVQQTFVDGVLSDLVWNHADPRFISVVKRFGLLESTQVRPRDNAASGTGVSSERKPQGPR
jgi:serine/threonine protein kinase